MTASCCTPYHRHDNSPHTGRLTRPGPRRQVKSGLDGHHMSHHIIAHLA
eukprot:CAMPEP_0196150472 /NCGR_PEP_ID=MMETSP0910-20130528/31811_1 /TAXON_ID=49265 /ORGANISM="Thalassiosira rotula, Strain GSO102" /LENGTH=48 /DNA_ID= /DNA_START= /DNA_END= /DNA_ORIENTATION=